MTTHLKSTPLSIALFCVIACSNGQTERERADNGPPKPANISPVADAAAPVSDSASAPIPDTPDSTSPSLDGGQEPNPAAPPSTPNNGDAGSVPSPNAGDGQLGFTVPSDSPPDVALPACTREINVNNDERLEEALGAAAPGDCLLLADGNYSALKVTVLGTADAPIVIRSTNRLGATLNDGQLEIKDSSHLVLEGLTIRTPNTMKVINCQSCRITRNKFALTVDDDWLVIFGNDSQSNRFDRNEFGPKATPGPFMVFGQEDTMSTGDRVDLNYFHDNGPAAVNEKEAVRIGWSGVYQREANIVVERNLFENCDGDPEVISVKTHKNIVRYNTVRSSAGVLSLRHGNGTFLYGNYVLGGKKEVPCENRDGEPRTCQAGGIRIYGRDHKIFNNYIEGTTGTGFRAAIQIDGGDGSSSDSHHQVVNLQLVANTLVGNAGGIEIGRNYSSAPKDSIIAYNLVSAPEGTAVQNFKDGSSITYAGNIFWSDNGSLNVGLAFTPEQASIVDPRLERVGEVMKIAQDSPAINAAPALADYLTTDIEGQARDTPDTGADELGGMGRPLTPADVGPDAL